MAAPGDDRRYLPFARRWKRVRFSIFLCFFFRMRLRRFLISEPMRLDTLPGRTLCCENDARMSDKCEICVGGSRWTS